MLLFLQVTDKWWSGLLQQGVAGIVLVAVLLFIYYKLWPLVISQQGDMKEELKSTRESRETERREFIAALNNVVASTNTAREQERKDFIAALNIAMEKKEGRHGG